MDTKKESKKANVPVIAAIITSIVAFLGGVSVAQKERTAGSDTCEISINAKNIGGNITTKMRSEGNQDSCYTLLASINAQLAGVSADDSSDDSAASDTDAASAPVGASQ